jgi:hypothetical protein
MAITVNGVVAAGSTDGNSVTTGSLNTTGASLLVVCFAGTPAGSLEAISDSLGNTWTEVTRATGNGSRSSIWCAVNPTVGAAQTFSASASGGFPSIVVIALNGVTLSSPLDQESVNASSSTVTFLTNPSVTPTQNNEICITTLCTSAAATASINQGYTIDGTVAFSSGAHQGAALAYLIQTTAAATNPTWSSSASVYLSCAMATFFESTGNLIGTAAGSGVGSGTITGIASISGAAHGAGTCTALIGATVKISGSSVGTATVTGTIISQYSMMVGASTGTATVTGFLTGIASLNGTAAGAGVVTGSLLQQGSLSGTANGIATVTGNLTAIGYLAGFSNGAATCTASITGINSLLSGTAHGSAFCVGSLGAPLPPEPPGPSIGPLYYGYPRGTTPFYYGYGENNT